LSIFVMQWGDSKRIFLGCFESRLCSAMSVLHF
jgi:hypothetical protein